MEEEEIQDHGDATIEDSERMISDLDALEFNSYLIGILRQLVGVDLLREQEVFYLPQPGENIRRARRKSTVDRTTLTRLSVAGIESGSALGSPRTSAASIRSPAASSISRAPISAAGSTSTSTGSMLKKHGSEFGSLSSGSISESDLTDEDQVPKAKRRRPSPTEEKGEKGDMAPPEPPSASTHLKFRRSKRLGKDAAAYKPEADPESPDEDVKTKGRRKKASRGVKRTRTTDPVDDNESHGRKTKKQKLRTSASL